MTRGKLILSVLAGLLLIGCDSSSTDAPAGPGHFMVPSGTVQLESTLDLPPTDGPHPAIVIIGGSDNTPYNPDEPLVEFFAASGFGVLQFNKRGVGASTGNHPIPTTDQEENAFYSDRAADVEALVNFLATHLDIDSGRIGVWGSSQGGWVASLASVRSNQISFMVASSGGASPTDVEGFYDALADDPSLTIDELNQRVAAYDGPLGFDPRTNIRDLSIPSLWVYGGQDRSNPTANDIAELEAIRSQTGQAIAILLYENANHDLIDVSTGQLPDGLIADVLVWLNGVIR